MNKRGNVQSRYGGMLTDISDYIIQNDIPEPLRDESLKLKNSAITNYPNPAKTHITVSCESSFNKLSIYHITGKMILEKNHDKEMQNYTLQLNLSKGIYILKLSNKEDYAYSKLIVN